MLNHRYLILLNNIHIVDSDSDGIHVEGTAIVGGNVSNSLILDTDDNGIVFDMDGGADNATFIQIHKQEQTEDYSASSKMVL